MSLSRLAIVLGLLLPAAAQESHECFDLAKTSLDKGAAAGLGGHLAGYAQALARETPEYAVIGNYRKLVRVAYQLAPDDPTVAAAHARIKAAQAPEAPKQNISKEDLVSAIEATLTKLKTGKGKDDWNASRFICAIGLLIEPRNELCLVEMERLRRGGEIPWDRVLGVYRRPVADGSTHSVNGLTVASVEGTEVGQVARIVLTFRAGATSILNVKLLREEASQLTTSAEEAIRYWERIRKHQPLPGGLLEISFEDKFSKKDGPSAGAAFAVLLRSFSDPFTIDSFMSMTGDVAVDGRVLPVGGIFAKVRGAALGGCTRVGIPTANEADLVDGLILYGPATLGEIEILGIDSMDDAVAFARSDRDERSTKVSADFMALRALIDKRVKGNTDPALAAAIQKSVSEIAAASPRHISAKLLDAWINRKLPTTLSLATSLDESHDLFYGYLSAIRKEDEVSFKDISHEAKTTAINETVRKLRDLMPKLHADAQKSAQKLLGACSAIQAFIRKRDEVEAKEKKVKELDKDISDLRLKIDRAKAENRSVDEINRLVKKHNARVEEYKGANDQLTKTIEERQKMFQKVVELYNEYVAMVRMLTQDAKLLEKLQHGK